MNNKIWIFVLILISSLISFYAFDYYHKFSDRVFISSIVIQVISIINIFNREKEPFSLHKMFFLFSFFFFGIAPLLQFYNSSRFFGAQALTEPDYYFTNILIIIILILYNIFYNLFRRIRVKKPSSVFIYKLLKPPVFGKTQTHLLLLLSLLSFFFVFKANDYSILSMIFRGGDFKNDILMNKVDYLITFRFLQPLSMIIFYIYLISNNRNNITLTLLGLIALITCFPISMPRFSAAALYIPLLLLIAPVFKKKNVFTLTFILGLLIVFPFLNVFRTFSSDSVFKPKIDTSMFTSGNFDSYQNFALVVSSEIVTWGRQLIGVLFFWVPRSLWIKKPIGSGAFLAEELNFEFTNVSCNYFAEGYINFGFIGVFLFIILLSYFSANLDRLYWRNIRKKEHRYIDVIYYILIGMIFFILRGDLMSAFAYIIGMLSSFFILYLISSNRVTDK